MLDRALLDKLDESVKTTTARYLFIEIMYFYNQSKEKAWPSIKKLAERMKVDYRTITRSLKELEQAEIIRRIKRKGQSNIYEVDRAFLRVGHQCPIEQEEYVSILDSNIMLCRAKMGVVDENPHHHEDIEQEEDKAEPVESSFGTTTQPTEFDESSSLSYNTSQSTIGAYDSSPTVPPPRGVEIAKEKLAKYIIKNKNEIGQPLTPDDIMSKFNKLFGNKAEDYRRAIMKELAKEKNTDLRCPVGENGMPMNNTSAIYSDIFAWEVKRRLIGGVNGELNEAIERLNEEQQKLDGYQLEYL